MDPAPEGAHRSEVRTSVEQQSLFGTSPEGVKAPARHSPRPRQPRDFFDEKQAPAVLKHGILKRQLPAFGAKTSWRSPNRQIAYLDTHAGAGRYLDGSEGSPAIGTRIANLFEGMKQQRDLRCYFVEKDNNTYETLTAHFADHPHVWIAPRGTIEEKIDLVLDKIGDDPLLAFLDPFGLPPVFAVVERLLGRYEHFGGRDRGPITDVLMTFSTEAVNRIASLLTSSKSNQGDHASLKRLSDAMAGTWWQSIWEGEPENKRLEIILETYMTNIQNTGPGWQVFAVPVFKKLGSPPVYYLVFVTRHPAGVAVFSESCSLAIQDYCEYLERGKFPLNFGAGGLKRYGYENWVPEIKANIDNLLRFGNVEAKDSLPEIYGRTFGLARPTHVHRALKQLAVEGKADYEWHPHIEKVTITRSGHALSQPKDPRQRPASRPMISRIDLVLRPSEFGPPIA